VSGTRPTRPPRLPRALLRWMGLRQDRSFLVADLDEEYAAMESVEGTRRARRWYREQVVRSMLPLVHARVRSTRGLPPPRRWTMLMIGDDLRAAGRVFMKEPMFAATLVATLALGIGAATALATIANAILVRPLPMPDSGRIHVVQIETQAAPSPDTWFPLSDADFLAWQSQSRTLDVAAWASNQFTLTGRGDPEPLRGATVTTRFFDVVGIRPAVGRAFEPSDTAPVAILSDEAWTRFFGRDLAIVGQVVTLNGWQGTVIGVMPPGFSYPRQRTDVWAHLRMSPPARRGPFYLTGVGRLRDDATLAETAAELERTSAALKAQFGGEMNWKLAIESLKEQTIRPARAGLYMLLSAVGCLLLIAATNSANLSLVRGIRRHREIAVRTALGAPRWRVARQLVIESLAFAGSAGVIGLGIAAAIVAVVRVTAADTLPRLAEVRIDAGAFAIAVGLSLMTGLLFGLLPSWLSSRSDPADALRQLGRPGAGAGRRPWAQRLVVSLELALAVVLASSGGLMIRSFVNLQRTNVGIQPDGVLTFKVEIPSSQYPRGPKRADFYERLLDGLSRVPGVEAAGLGVSLPPEELFVTDNYTVAGFEVPAGESAPVGPIVVASDKYFEALRIPLLQGRLFQPSDTATSERVVIVSHAIARKYFPAGDAIGRRFRTGGPERPNNPWMTIVGVVGDVKFDGLARDPSEAYYLPLAQELWNGLFAVLRTSGDPAAVMPGVRSAVRQVDAQLALRNVLTMTERMADASARPRFHTLIAAALGFTGMLLAGFGIYSVVSYQAAQRVHEFGVRAALGARADHLSALVLREGLVLAGIGTVLGIAGALVSTRLFSTLLFDVTPTDPITFAGLIGLFAVVTIVACARPASRAARTNPLQALRDQV
jgi:putative ABC transport system permease protein